MAEVFLKITDAQIAYVQQTFTDMGAIGDTVLRTATNETLRKFRTQLTNMLAEEHLAGKRDIRDRVKVSQLASGKNFEGAVSVSHSLVPLIDFKTRFTKRGGAKVQMLTSTPQQQFKFAFKSSMNSGHTGGFQRVKGAEKVAPQTGSYKGRRIKRGPRAGQFLKRQPIKELFGVPVVRVFDILPDLTDRATRDLGEMFVTALDRKIDWQLQKIR